MNSNTIPEQRVNKLGHTVTKHVRAQKAIAPVSVPNVSPPPSDDHERRLTDCATRLYEDFNKGAKHQSHTMRRVIVNVTSLLRDLDMATLERIESMDPRHTPILLNMVLALRDERSINDFLVLADVMADDGIEEIVVNHYLRSLVHYQGLVPQGEDSEYPEERRSQCTAIVRVMHHMNRSGMDLHVEAENGTGIAYIKDDALRELLLSEEVDREALVHVIIESCVFDADQVKNLAETVHPSLLSGAL
jgi:hypothetical protein